MIKINEIRHILQWFLREVLVFRKSDIVAVIFFDVLGITLQTAGFAAIMIYIHHLSNKTPIKFLGKDLQVFDSIAAIILAGFCFFLLIGVAGLAIYKGRAITAKLARLYEEYTLCQMFNIYAHPNTEKCFEMSFYENKRNFQTFTARAPNYLGRIYMEVMSSIVPIIAMMLSFAILVYIEAFLTFILVVVLCTSLPIHYFLNKVAYNSSEGLKQYAKGYAVSKANAIDSILSSPDKDEIADDHKIRELLLSESTKNFLNNYEIRLKITHSSLMVTNFVGAMMIFALFIYMAYNVKYNNSGWTIFLFYLIPLKYLMSGLRSAFKLYTKFHTFLPYFKPYLFIKSSVADNDGSNGQSHDDGIQTIELTVPDFLSPINRSVTVNRGKPVYIISIDYLSLLVANAIVYRLNELSPPSSHKIKKLCLLSKSINNMEDVFRIVVKNYSGLVALARITSDYQLLSVKRLRERIDRKEIISPPKFAKIWASLSLQIKLFISSEICRDTGSTCNFIDCNSFATEANDIAWHYVAPSAFNFIHSDLNRIGSIKKIPEDYLTLVYLNNSLKYFDINDPKHFQKFLFNKNEYENNAERILIQDMVEDDLLE